MTLLALTLMVFLITMGLSLSALYFFVEAPAARRRMRTRLAAIEQAYSDAPSEEVDIIRGEVLSEIPAIHRLFLRIPVMVKLQLWLQQAAMDITAATIVLISMALVIFMALVSIVAGLPAILTLAVALTAGLAPYLVIGVKRQRRLSKFEEMFPEAIDTLARAVRAGHAFTTGLELIAREMPEPIAGEFRATYEQQNFGMPLRDALGNLTTRIPLQDVRFFVTALQIQRESGGNLAEILDNLSYVIRERFKILRQVKVFTAQGRLTLYILTALPPLAALMMTAMNPEYTKLLFTDPLGLKIIVFAVILQIIGFLVIRKIIRIRI